MVLTSTRERFISSCVPMVRPWLGPHRRSVDVHHVTLSLERNTCAALGRCGPGRQ
jgi:hypothetical protein